MIRSPRHACRQRGITLIVALVLLMAISMLGIWAFNGSTTNTRVVSNMEIRKEAMVAAQTAVEQTISSALFTTNPAGVAASAVPITINGTTYNVALKDKNGNRKPACYRVRVVKQKDLNVDSSGDRPCMKDAGRDTGMESEVPPPVITSGDSMCSETEWNVYAEATDARTGAFVAVNQGVGARVLTTDADNACP
ncbi:MAG: pilus assembly PilX N-terminal domain-containing protein [Burkholderiales bacterium]|jgi:Tfp pilus assembly protein PilX|nr:pilus assembly PilX N-terminal domain-containing protein [Burkholderiales bacterium]